MSIQVLGGLKTKLLILIFASALLSAACQSDGGGDNSAINNSKADSADSSDTQADQSFEVTLLVRDQFAQPTGTFLQGEVITLELSIKNLSDSKTETLIFASSQEYDFAVKDNSDSVVWQWSSGLGFFTAVTEVEILPQETYTISRDWDQIVGAGNIPIGNYTIEGWFLHYGDVQQSDLLIQ